MVEVPNAGRGKDGIVAKRRDPERSRRRRKLAVAGASVASVAAGLPFLAGTLSAVTPISSINPPAAGMNVIVFPARDFISATGFVHGVVDVEILRHGHVVGAAYNVIPQDDAGTPEFDGLVEVNHPGGACWGDNAGNSLHITPDIRSGDVVRITEQATNIAQATDTEGVVVTQAVTQINANTVEMRGTAFAVDAAGDLTTNPLPVGDLEARLVGSSKDKFANGRRTLRATSAAGNDGTLVSNAGNWIATFTNLSSADVQRAIAAESRIMWLGATGTEATVYEVSDLVAPGPAAPCAAPLEGPALSTNVTRLDFPATLVTESTLDHIVVTNTGHGTSAASMMTISSVTVAGVDAASFNVTMGNCPATGLAVNQSCALDVRFAPASSGFKSAVVHIVSNAGNADVPVDATGFALDDGSLIAYAHTSPGLLSFGTRAEGNTSPASQVSVRNLGNVDMVISNLSVTNPSGGALSAPDAGAFAIVSNAGCLNSSGSGPAYVVKANETCTIDLAFTPTAPGDHTAYLSITSNAVNSPSRIELDGDGLTFGNVQDPPAPPKFLATFPERDFISAEGFGPGEIITMQVIRHGVVVGTAQGAADDTGLIEVNHPGGYCWEGTTPDLRAGDTVRWVTDATDISPAATYVTHIADVGITQQALDVGSLQVQVKGWARDENGAPLPLGALDQRLITSSADRFLINDRRALTSSDGFGALSYDTVDNPDGTKWTVTYQFTDPADVTRAVQRAENRILWLGRDPLLLTEATLWEMGPNPLDVVNGPAAPCTAPAQAPTPDVKISPAAHTFPARTVGASASTTFTLANTGTAPLVVSSVSFAGTNPSDFAVTANDCANVAASSTCTITVRFTAGGIGSRTATMRVSDNVTGSPHTAALSASGVAAAVGVGQLGLSTVSFPDTAVGSTATAVNVAFTNTGEGPLTITNPTVAFGGANPADFAATGSCLVTLGDPLVLEAGQNCTLTFTFTPSAIGNRGATATLVSDASNSPHMLTLSGSASTVGGVFDPPRSPISIGVFPVRDFVSAAGFLVDDRVTVEVYDATGTQLKGSAANVIPTDDPTTNGFDGIVEVNHAGGAPWTNVTPDIVPGDIVRTVRTDISGLARGKDQTHVADVWVDTPTTQTGPSTVVMAGTYASTPGLPAINVGALEARIVSATTAASFQANGRRTLRTGVDAGATLVASGGRWTATFTGLSAQDVTNAVAGASVMIWLGRDPLALTETTHNEFGEVPGPDPTFVAVAPSHTPELSAAPSTVNLGLAGIGTPAVTAAITLTNDGVATVGVPDDITVGSPISPSGLDPADFTVVGNTCGTLTAGNSCQLSVSFHPSAVGLHHATLPVRHSGSNAVTYVLLTGTGVTAPAVTTFTPSSGSVGALVTVTGSSFTGTTAVTVNGIAANFTLVSDTSLTLTVPNGAATGNIAITNPAGTTMSAAVLTVLGAAPTITSFNPATGAPGTLVTITGTGLTGVSRAFFNNVQSASVTIVNDTTVTATVPATATTGAIRVEKVVGVATLSGTSATNFTVVPPPTITSFNPTSGKAGTRLVITGTNMTGVNLVTFVGATLGSTTTATPTVNSATQITVTVPNNATDGAIIIRNGTTGLTATSLGFTGPARIDSADIFAGGPNTNVTIIGAGLTGANKVSFNGKSGTIVSVSRTSVIARPPAGAGTGPITIETPTGKPNSPFSYTVLVAPTVTSFDANVNAGGIQTTARLTDGFTASVTGTGLTGATTVDLVKGATVVTVNATNVTATGLRFVLPNTALVAGWSTGTWTVRVTTPGGTASAPTALSITN